MKSAKTFIVFTFLLAFALQVSAQNIQFPNELKGFEFFGNGKIKGFELGISNKNDVQRVFGSNCEKFCEYDSEWKIEFWYFDEKAYIETYKQGQNGEIIDYKYFVPEPKVLGTIRSITIKPKKQFSFSQVKFSDEFENYTSTIGGQNSLNEWVNVTYENYEDSNGLIYSFFDDDKYQKIEYDGDKRQRGDLLQIEYTIPKEKLKKMFIEKQK